MQKYSYQNEQIDAVDLKCLLISRGVKVDNEVYRRFAGKARFHPNALMCNCIKLPDETITQLTDLGVHLSTVASMFSWDNLKLLKYMGDMTTEFRLAMYGDKAALFCGSDFVCEVGFLLPSRFYAQKTSSGMPFLGNAVIQGCNWVAFQCLWPCEYACAGQPCQFCFSGGQYETLQRKHKPMPYIPTPRDVAEVVAYALQNDNCDSVQLTGGSTFKGEDEAVRIRAYMEEINAFVGRDALKGEILLYITPPDDMGLVDEYFALGAGRIACSLEVWDDARAVMITPGKRKFTTKERHLRALSYIADKYGPGKAFSNFIIGLEELNTLREGATYLAERGIVPSAAVWIPFGKPVMGSMKPPSLDFFRAVKEMLGELYDKYNLTPPGGCGLNACVDKDIWAHRQVR